MWLASPSANTNYSVMLAYYSGNMTSSSYTDGAEGFRPIVCLKSNIHLLDNGDNTYSIKEAITAKAEYNKDTNQIEVRIAYSENEISKIMLNNTNELSMTNTNGLITANTQKINLAYGTYTITIIDNKGNTKELEVKVKAQLEYGSKVFGYECNTEGIEWRLFHADDNNVYLIADDYVPYDSIPTSKAGTALNKGATEYNAYFTNVISNYGGSRWIKENANSKAQKLLSKYLTAYPQSENNNMRAVAYMMDTNKWGEKFAGEKAEYAIGGPTIELFCASYKVTHPDRYIECGISGNGYTVRWSDSGYANYINELTQDDFNSIYIKSDSTKADGMWIASPSANGASYVMCVHNSGSVYYYDYNTTALGFRPVVCLKSEAKLIDNGNGTYSIQ